MSEGLCELRQYGRTAVRSHGSVRGWVVVASHQHVSVCYSHTRQINVVVTVTVSVPFNITLEQFQGQSHARFSGENGRRKDENDGNFTG